MKTTIIDNQTLIKEEQLGYESQYLVRNETSIHDPEVRKMIAQMSVSEFVS